MARHSNAVWLAGALLMAVAGTAMAQAVTTADYERAVRMLGDRTAPLLDQALSNASWLDDNTLVYRLEKIKKLVGIEKLEDY